MIRACSKPRLGVFRMADSPIHVEVTILPWFSEIVVPGQHRSLTLEEELPSDSSLRTLLSLLAARYTRFGEVVYNPKQDALQGHVVITHNGRLISAPASLDVTLQGGDSVALIPAYSGG
jgi:molybdopterin converting factor small subunit